MNIKPFRNDEPKKNCFGFENQTRNGCTALTVRECEKCKFFKTRAQVKEEKQKTKERLLNLEYSERAGIAERYKLKNF